MPDGSKVDILKLYDLLKDREVIQMPIEQIKSPSRSERSGFSQVRLKRSDVSFPLIIDENRFLVDGRHRFFKLLDAGETMVKVKFATAEDLATATVADESELTRVANEAS
jgi:hypothetical protein